MGKLLKNRLLSEGIEPKEVAEYAWDWGIWNTLSKYKIKTLEPLDNFLALETGDPDYLRKCISNSENNKPIHKRLFDEAILRYLNAETEVEKYRKRIEFLEEKERLYTEQDEMQAMELLKFVRAKPLLETIRV